MQPFTAIFLAALILTLGTRIWLATRHIRHVQAHRDRVPTEFSSQITLEAHQKAADYTCAKTRLGYVSMFLEVIVLMILTLGGGLNVLAGLWSSWFSDPITHGAALIISTVLLMSAVGIPVSYYRTFVIEEQFGFNKMTPQMFFLDLAKQGTIGGSAWHAAAPGRAVADGGNGAELVVLCVACMDGVQYHITCHIPDLDRADFQQIYAPC